MINVTISPDFNNIKPEQIINIVNKIFEILPKDDVALQAIIKNFDASSMTADVIIPLSDKNISLLIKLPENIDKNSNLSFQISFKDKEIKLIFSNQGSDKEFSIKLSDNLNNFIKDDFKIRSLKVDLNQNISNTNNDKLSVFPLKPVEIMNPFMKGKVFEAFVLKDIPLNNKIDLKINNENGLNPKLIEPKLPLNTKLIVEITKISPPMIDGNIEDNLKTFLNDKVLNENTKINQTDETTISKVTKQVSENEFDKIIENTFKNKDILKNELNPLISKESKEVLSLNNIILKTLKSIELDIETIFKQIKSNDEFKPFDIKGIVISKPDDKSQKILISDVGVITLPELKEKLPFKSVIDLKIKNIVSFERIFEEFASSNNEPCNSIIKIINELKNNINSNTVLKDFVSNIPSLDEKILTKTIKYINALKNNNYGEVFDEKLIEEIETHLKDKGFFTKILKEEFTNPIHQNTAVSKENNFSLFVIPLLNGDNISKMWLYLFNPLTINDEKDKQAKPKTKQRFILDFDLSNLGNMQFEGFIDEPNKKLDLVLKSKQDFEEAEKNEMNQIFINSMKVLDMIGSLKFKKQAEIVRPFEQRNNGGYFA
ncbi:MAG: hypothetical protein BWY78_00501 [Alphaproteobacteria bacterium ADurb.Bin438]|nr:MAG: hypothetical protein BWY78_00501 [Alphaproteobacteria bacterium ADurb.Bin438]